MPFSMAYCNIYLLRKYFLNLAGNFPSQQAFISRLLKINVEMMPLSTAINV